MKKAIACFLALLMCFSCFSVISFAEETTGEHLTIVPDGYIGVYTIEDLYCIRNDLTANYILMNDIDLTEATAEGGDWNYGSRGAEILLLFCNKKTEIIRSEAANQQSHSGLIIL